MRKHYLPGILFFRECLDTRLCMCNGAGLFFQVFRQYPDCQSNVEGRRISFKANVVQVNISLILNTRLGSLAPPLNALIIIIIHEYE